MCWHCIFMHWHNSQRTKYLCISARTCGFLIRQLQIFVEAAESTAVDWGLAVFRYFTCMDRFTFVRHIYRIEYLLIIRAYLRGLLRWIKSPCNLQLLLPSIPELVQLLRAKLLPVFLVAVSLLRVFRKDVAYKFWLDKTYKFRSLCWIKMVFFAKLLEDIRM